jgi:pilus assembly protein CpaF
MAMMSEVRLAEKAVRSQIASAVHMIIQVSRMSDGTRRITHISELTGAFSDVISMQDIFLFEKQGIGPNGKVKGRFISTSIVPKCVEKFITAGIPIPAGMTEHVCEI